MRTIAVRRAFYTKKVKEAFTFGNFLCNAGDRNGKLGIHLTVGAFFANSGETICVEHGEVGTEQVTHCPSRAPSLGRLKMDNLREARTLLLKGEDLILSPQQNWLNPQDYMGAAMIIVRSDQVLLSVSCSGWAQQCDLQFALMVLYSMTHKVRLHHVGWSFPSEKKMRKAAAAIEMLWDVQGVDSPTDDQARVFVKSGAHVPSPQKFFAEFQYSLDIPPRIHWDLQVDDPEDFLTWMANALSGKAGIELWNENDTNPTGRVITVNKDEREHAVFARSNNWNPYNSEAYGEVT